MEFEMERSYDDQGFLVDPETVDWHCDCRQCREEFDNWCEDYDNEQKSLEEGKFWVVKKWKHYSLCFYLAW